MAQNEQIASENKKLMLVNVVCVSIMLALISMTAYMAIGKQISRIQDLESEQVALLAKLGIAPQINARIAEAENLLSEHALWMQFEVGPKIPNRLDVYGFYQQLSALAEDSQIVLQSMTPGSTEPELPEGYQGRLITIKASASFENLHRFLFSLTELKEGKVQLESLKVSVSRDLSMCRVDMELLLLARIEEKKTSSSQTEELVYGG